MTITLQNIRECLESIENLAKYGVPENKRVAFINGRFGGIIDLCEIANEHELALWINEYKEKVLKNLIDDDLGLYK